MKKSTEDITRLFSIHRAQKILEGTDGIGGWEWDSYKDMLETIDEIEVGEMNWHTFAVRYTGPVDASSPSWKRHTYIVHTRDARDVLHSMIGSPDFKGRWDKRPYRRYVKGQRTYSNIMSSKWAWSKAVRFFTFVRSGLQINVSFWYIQGEIAQDPQTHSAMMVPIILGADKTTVSVATGQTEFHPLYISPGNVFNDVRRAHREAVIPLAFLAIPKGQLVVRSPHELFLMSVLAAREADDDPEFRLFKKQLYHESIATILEPLRDAMTVPEVVQCGFDGHYRRVVYQIGPFIADYPEQVMLAGIVQNWCPK